MISTSDQSTKSLNICMVSRNFPPCSTTCGIGDYTARIVSLLAKKGHRVTVLTSSHYNGNLIVPNIKVIRFTLKWNLICLTRFIIHIYKSSFDIINVQYTPSFYSSFFNLLLFLTRIVKPLTVTFHALHDGTLKSKLATLLLIKFSTGVIATNDQISFMLNKFNLKGSAISEIPIGSNVGPVDSLGIDKKKFREELGISQNTLVLSHFGLFYPGKGLETLLEACKILLSENSDLVLLLIGSRRKEDSLYLDRIDNMIDEYNLKDKVYFTGFLEEKDVIRHLSASDIYVVPYDEGASTRRGSLIAGFIHGLPVISTFPTIPNQYLFNDTNIVFVQAHDSKALASKILALYKDPEKRAHLARQALRTARHFDWEKIGDETIRAFYSSLRPK